MRERPQAAVLEQYDAQMSERISTLIHEAAQTMASRGKPEPEMRDVLNTLAAALWVAALNRRKEIARAACERASTELH
jgi:hypothetical protein